MTGNNDTTPDRLTLVAIDIAKHYHDVLIEPPGPRRQVRLRLANRREDFERLAERLRGLRSCVMVGFEATGNYHRPLAYFLHRPGFQLRLVPTLALARVRVWHTLRNHYFALYFPEIDRFVRSNHSVWMVQLLASFPTPLSITCLSEAEFQTRAWNLSDARSTSARYLLRSMRPPNSRSACPWRSTVPRSRCSG